MSDKQRTEAILAISTGLLVCYFIWELELLIQIALGIALVGLLIKPLANLIAKAWFKLAEILAMFIPRILLGVVFYLILFPLSLLAKISNKDRLQLKRKEGSYYVEREGKLEKSSFEKTW